MITRWMPASRAVFAIAASSRPRCCKLGAPALGLLRRVRQAVSQNSLVVKSLAEIINPQFVQFGGCVLGTSHPDFRREVAVINFRRFARAHREPAAQHHGRARRLQASSTTSHWPTPRKIHVPITPSTVSTTSVHSKRRRQRREILNAAPPPAPPSVSALPLVFPSLSVNDSRGKRISYFDSRDGLSVAGSVSQRIML